MTLKVRFRNGVHLGEVRVDGGGIHGDGVNVAARLEGLAEPGGICIPEAVRGAVGTKLPLGHAVMGEREVKSTGEPVRSCRDPGPVAAGDEPPPCPCPGMLPFGATDAQHFRGRDDEVARMVQLLRLPRLVMVIGPSGSGTSSLIYAGMLPALASSRCFPKGYWLIRTIRPGSHPSLALVDCNGHGDGALNGLVVAVAIKADTTLSELDEGKLPLADRWLASADAANVVLDATLQDLVESRQRAIAAAEQTREAGRQREHAQVRRSNGSRTAEEDASRLAASQALGRAQDESARLSSMARLPSVQSPEQPTISQDECDAPMARQALRFSVGGSRPMQEQVDSGLRRMAGKPAFSAIPLPLDGGGRPGRNRSTLEYARSERGFRPARPTRRRRQTRALQPGWKAADQRRQRSQRPALEHGRPGGVAGGPLRP